jgi:hypothetical protein
VAAGIVPGSHCRPAAPPRIGVVTTTGIRHPLQDAPHPNAIVLDGHPNKARVQALLAAIGMPRKARCIVLVKEIMKRWSQATITLDPQSLRIMAFKVEGTNQMQPFLIESTFTRKGIE